MDSLLGAIMLIALLHCYFSNIWDRIYQRLWGARTHPTGE